MSKDYTIDNIGFEGGWAYVRVVGETPDAMRQGRDAYLRDYPSFPYETQVLFETSQACEIKRWHTAD